MSKAESNSQHFAGMEWMDLHGLTRYASVSERTLRGWIRRPINPLPAVQVGNKLLVKRSIFDDWLSGHSVAQSQSVDLIVNDVMQDMLG